MWEENLGTQAGVHLIEGGCLTRGLPNTRLFTVYVYFKMTDYIDGH